jgi:predicted  nucleic acid-binding Zn-ribbon protein
MTDPIDERNWRYIESLEAELKGKKEELKSWFNSVEALHTKMLDAEKEIRKLKAELDSHCECLFDEGKQTNWCDRHLWLPGNKVQ